MIPLLQAFTLGDFAGFIGVGIAQSFGGSLFLIGLAILFVIGLFCWRYNVHITGAFFMSFIALSILKEYFNDPSNDIGLFGTLYNIMLFGMAVVFVMFINDLRK